MKVVYHPAVQKDVNGILRHYDRIAPSLGDEFWDELMAHVQAAAEHPERFHFDAEGRRRVNLRKFPYHFLFREMGDGFASRWFGTTNAIHASDLLEGN